jgi:opacity protein-like surface antigen
MPTFGSVKDYKNAAVPVPAPTPSSVANKDWYIRGDVGYNISSNADATASGPLSSPGFSASQSQSLDGFLFGSVGFGRYISQNVRAELSLDWRPNRTVTHGTQSYTITKKQAGAVAGTTDVMTYAITQTDDAVSTDQNIFANLYYDFANSSRFTPYIGAGIGVDQRRLKRVSSQDPSCASTTNYDDATQAPTGPATLGCPAGAPTATRYINRKEDGFAYGVAAALMIGAAYEVGPGVLIDSGYRMVWQGAEIEQSAQGFDGSTSIRISDRLDHEWRTGIRIDLN